VRRAPGCFQVTILIQRNVVSSSENVEAWLAAADGNRYPIHGACSIGRAAANAVVLNSPKVSRRHALIHLQNIGECWLIDFGSSNGTFLNKRRIHYPVRLTDGDQILIGDELLGFHQPMEISDEYRTLVTQRTLHQIENVPCWLLVTDICDFTPLSRAMEAEGLDLLLGKWLSTCKEIIERHHGVINKYLGDGFFAYWAEATTSADEVADAIIALKQFQDKKEPDFRIVVHFGSVAIGGIASMGEESLMGKEVNLVFRLEKLAGSLGTRCGLSASAHAKLAELLPAQPLGEHELKGFAGKCAFFNA
jgi:adenylate cyclase